MAKESAVTLAVCHEILAKIAATKAPVTEVALPPTLYNMVLIEREEDPRVAGVAVSRRP